MKVLHIGNTAGIPQILAKQQKKEGLFSETLAFKEHPFGYLSDRFYLPRGYFNHGYFPNAKLVLDNIPLLMKYDILHFHSTSLWPNGIDFVFLKLMGKKIIIHYHGSDIRGKGEKSLRQKYSNAAIVATPDLLQYSERAQWIPNPLDIQEYNPIQKKNTDDEINILHLPSNRAGKGTEYLISAIEKLKNEGYKIRFTLVENKPHQEIMEYYNQADIVVDQLLTGWYGVVTIEAMALKKAVCVYIREDLLKYLPFVPFRIASKEDIVHQLKKLIEENELREELGEKGRKFVEQVHEVKTVNEKVMQIYRGKRYHGK